MDEIIESIQSGDQVQAMFLEADGTQTSFTVKVLGMPEGGGDFVDLLVLETGAVLALNPNSPIFIGLRKGGVQSDIQVVEPE